MSLDILIEEFDNSIWVAVLNGGRLDGFEVDPIAEEVRWGSVYYAKVKSVDAAQDAVYVDLDGDNTGILYNRDVRLPLQDGGFKKGGEQPIGKVIKPGDMVVVQAKMAYLPKDNDADTPQEDKIPTMSMDVTLPGRYLIYCPMMSGHQISQRIRDKALRKQMRAMLEALEGVDGIILRAAAADMQTDILKREGQILREAWESMQKYLVGEDPQLIMLGPDAIQRALSDFASKNIDTIEVVTMDHLTQAEDWCSIFAPDLVTKIQPVELDNAIEDLALFEYRDIMGQIEALSHSYVFLPGGGNIIIQETAALIAVDVNRGSSKGSKLAVNIEAAKEAARQVRVRNAGGIIVIDFLKMKSKKEEGLLIAALEEAVNQDPCTVQIHGLTKLGLMEITRKRRTPPLQERFDSMPL